MEWYGRKKSSTTYKGQLRGNGLDLGALGRNTGEAIGVFSDVVTKSSPGLNGFKSSLNIHNLTQLEALLEKLYPPKWPEKVFGKPDASLVQQGGKLFSKFQCNLCHLSLYRTDLKTPIEAKMSPLANKGSTKGIGTDPWMACNAWSFRAPSGVLKGLDLFPNRKPIEVEDNLGDMLTATVKQALIGQGKEVVKATVVGFFGIPQSPTPTFVNAEVILGMSPKEFLKRKCETTENELLAYKARPLTGIWATAPYLHNGSVPTLYDLLLPPAERMQKFYVGSREFDPKHVGFNTDPGGDNTFLIDTSVEGNRNVGHEYGVKEMTDEERNALVEYMKTL